MSQIDSSDPEILVLDDDKAVRFSMQGFFADYGYKTHVAENTARGIEIMEDKDIDLAMVDLRLPDKNGIEFIRMAHQNNPQTIYIIYTGSVNYQIPDDIKELPQVADKVYIKPLPDLNIFIDKMKELKANL